MIRDDATRDQRLHEVLGRYYEAAESGTEPDQAAWIAENFDLADDLASFFANQDRLSQLVRPADPPIDDFGDYEILREIARGGMGVVYEAHQKSLNRTVALKMILDGAYASPDALRRFRIEAESAASLDHPNIVPIHEVNDHAGRPYISMKYLPGGSLADHLGDYLSNPRAAAKLLTTIARAVHHAHQRGVLHRDLKPANILLDDAGQPHVADFGLARRIEAEDNVTATRALIGSPPYMAPEQTLGRNGAISTATDVYGLGAVLYALMTGKAPFRGDSVLETIEKVRDTAPEPPSKINPRIDGDLETIGLKCLEKDASLRYGSASDFSDDLERWLRGEPIEARPVGRIESAYRWCRRNPLGTLSATLALTLMIGLIVGFVVIRFQKEEALAEARWANESTMFVMQGITEPMKKLADPDLASNPAFVEARQAAIDEAIGVYEEYLKRLSMRKSVFTMIGILTHIALLHTVAGDHPKAQLAFQRALDVAKERARQDPGNGECRLHVANIHAHLGMELWDVGDHLTAFPHFRAAREVFQLALELNPNNIDQINTAAWFLSLFQDRSYRDPEMALILARRVVAMSNDAAHNRLHMAGGVRAQFILGLAEYRMGNFAEARCALERSMTLREGGDAYEWFVMAMVLARQGERDAARKYLADATRWARRYRYSDFELHFLEQEASSLLNAR